MIVRQFKVCIQDRGRTAVIERSYVDRDYLDAYQDYYSRTFHDHPRNCQRIHFFSEEIQADDLLAARSASDVQAFNDFLQKAYLGFTVIRPTFPLTIGRTILKPPYPSDGTTFLLVKRRDTANLVGYTLKVVGMPFIEQDARSAACAGAAMWMANMPIARRSDLPVVSMTKLTSLAGSPRQPHEGSHSKKSNEA